MERNQERISPANPTRRVRIQLPEKELRTELTEDFTLPDYQPEIRRLLRITCTVRPPAGSVGAGNAEFSGNVDYTVLYMGNDGSLASAPLSTEYRFQVPIEAGSDFDLSDAPTVFCLCRAENVNGRVTAPRKLTLRCRLASLVRSEATCMIGERYQGELPPEGEQCRLTGEFGSETVLYGMDEGVTLSDEIIPDSPTDTLRVLSADGRVFLTGAEAGSGTVRCRGDLILTLTTQKEAPEPEKSVGSLLDDAVAVNSAGDPQPPDAPAVPELHTITRKLPIDAEIPVDGADVSCAAAAWGTCTDLSVSVEDGRILVDAGLTLEALCQKRETNEYTKDLYADGRSCTVTYTERKIPVALGAGIGNLSVGGTAALGDLGIRPGARVLDVTGTAQVTGITEEKGKPVLTGVCRFHLLTADAGGEISPAEAEFPFRYTVEGTRSAAGNAGGVDDVSGDAVAELVSCRARIDGERLAADGEVTVAFRLSAPGTVRMPESVRFGERNVAPAGGIRICYPAPGETLWDVAKRFAVPVSVLTGKNDLPAAPRADDPASLGDARYLLI